MKFLKIILIIALLVVTSVAFSYGTGTIESGDKVIYLCPPPEEFNTLDEWFTSLSLREKIDIYDHWSKRVYIQDLE